MTSETRQCQNCKQNFVIEPDDFSFYEHIKVPPPTFCPLCRFQRRLAWRNERNLYKRKCDAPGHNETIIAMYPQESGITVYDTKYWWSDEWDPMRYGRAYDFARPFFEQWYDLLRAMPAIALININDVESDYCNFTYQSKNCYLNFASDMNEDTAYLYHSIENRNCFDTLGARKNENCYELVDCESCYESDHLFLSENCLNSKYCYDCRNCQHCLGCVGLRSAKYCILNEHFSQQGYEKRVHDLKLDTKEGRRRFEENFRKFLLTKPRKFSNSRHTLNSIGDYLNGAKNCKDCFDVEGPAEDSRFLVYGVTNIKDVYDASAVGMLEKSYDVMDAGLNMHDVAFCGNIWDSYSTRYCWFMRNCSHCFGCVGIRNKQYCILNKQYSKEEYEKFLSQIMEHMKATPYRDKKGRVYCYGEFFPTTMSPFPYNESIAQEYVPISREEALASGYVWRDAKDKSHLPTKLLSNIPESIKDVKEDILQELIECKHGGKCGQQCTKAFRVLSSELQLFRKLNIPIPELCVNCRHYERLKERNPFRLYHRRCSCDYGIYKNTAQHLHHALGQCPNEFETTYSPDRKEIVYCEQCYNAEVV